MLILGGRVDIAMILFLPETYPSKVLQDKVRRLGQIPEHKNVRSELYTNLTRPWLILLTEPISFRLSLYMAFVYGILYLDFTAYPST